VLVPFRVRVDMDVFTTCPRSGSVNVRASAPSGRPGAGANGPRPPGDPREHIRYVDRMKLHLDAPAGTNMIKGYAPGQLRVGNATLTSSALVAATTLLPWRPASVADLTSADLEPLYTLAPEVVLLGTGARQQFPDAALLATLHARRIGVEIMDTPAACRTYNVLVAEGRSVVAALIV